MNTTATNKLPNALLTSMTAGLSASEMRDLVEAMRRVDAANADAIELASWLAAQVQHIKSWR